VGGFTGPTALRGPGRERPLEDRAEAGRRLAEDLRSRSLPRPVVLGIPRGGVPVAGEIARVLGAPLDVLVVRKVGAPGDPEYGLGAVAEGGVVRIDARRARDAGFSREMLEPTIRAELAGVAERVHLFRGGRRPIELDGRTAIVVDDGVATGGTLEVALSVVRSRGPARVVAALGVAPRAAVERLRSFADDVVVALVPPVFEAVGQWYHEFEPVGDREVLALLARVGQPPA
jgi:putative phosphoribosyl transferase